MRKVVRISNVLIDYWQFQDHDLHSIAWKGASRRKR